MRQSGERLVGQLRASGLSLRRERLSNADARHQRRVGERETPRRAMTRATANNSIK